jgi:hypothetical protein
LWIAAHSNRRISVPQEKCGTTTSAQDAATIVAAAAQQFVQITVNSSGGIPSISASSVLAKSGGRRRQQKHGRNDNRLVHDGFSNLGLHLGSGTMFLDCPRSGSAGTTFLSRTQSG